MPGMATFCTDIPQLGAVQAKDSCQSCSLTPPIQWNSVRIERLSSEWCTCLGIFKELIEVHHI